jgi:hypothetical protein
VNPDIWDDVFAITGGLYYFSLTIQTLDYWIPTKNLWILDFPRYTLDRRIRKASP